MKLHKIKVKGEYKNTDRKLSNYELEFYVESLDSLMSQIKKLATKKLANTKVDFTMLVTHYCAAVDDVPYSGTGSRQRMDLSKLPVSELLEYAEDAAGLNKIDLLELSKSEMIDKIQEKLGVEVEEDFQKWPEPVKSEEAKVAKKKGRKPKAYKDEKPVISDLDDIMA